jgi:hypothetical protein
VIIAVLDAYVLYPPSVRDLLLRVASFRLFEPRWTNEIRNEWTTNVLKDNAAISASKLERTCQLMEQFNPNCLVVGYETLVPSLNLPDPDDRHVLAAAIHSAASFIVTYNLADFPDVLLNPFDIESIHPDLFLTSLCYFQTGHFYELYKIIEQL